MKYEKYYKGRNDLFSGIVLSAFSIAYLIGATRIKIPKMLSSSLYYRVVVIRAPLQGLCYNVRDAVDWFSRPTARRFQKGSNHSPLQYC